MCDSEGGQLHNFWSDCKQSLFMLQKFSHPPLLTPSRQLILPECSPHIDLCSSFNLIAAASESFSPSLSQNSGRSCNFPLLPHLFLLPQQAVQGKEEWKPRSFLSFQPAERNRGQGTLRPHPCFKPEESRKCKWTDRACQLGVLLVSLPCYTGGWCTSSASGWKGGQCQAKKAASGVKGTVSVRGILVTCLLFHLAHGQPSALNLSLRTTYGSPSFSPFAVG